MNGFEILIISSERQALRIGDGLLKLGRELVDAHGRDPRRE